MAEYIHSFVDKKCPLNKINCNKNIFNKDLLKLNKVVQLASEKINTDFFINIPCIKKEANRTSSPLPHGL